MTGKQPSRMGSASPSRGKYPRLAPDRIQVIASLAETVAETHCPNLPVQPSVILKAKRLTISHEAYGDTFDGLLEHRDGQFHVFCNLDRVGSPDSARARFTLAHELGHFFIDEHRNALRAGADVHGSQTEYLSGNPIEVEADLFASHLLLPTGPFLRAVGKRGPSLESVIEIANEFGTSLSSTAIRFAGVDVHPCVVIRWAPEGYAWKWLSPQAHRSRFWSTIEDIEAVPEDSATGTVLKGGATSPGAVVCRGTTAAAWFPWVPEGASRNIILREQAVSLGRFGAMTMLFPDGGRFPD